MPKATLFALLSLTLPAAALAQADAPPATAESATAAPQMTPEQIAAFNAAITTFTAGQSAQQAGDNATAAAKYEEALPAIRAAVAAQPDNIDNVHFLANALYADAAAQGSLGKVDKLIALFAESVPHWRKLTQAKPDDETSRNLFAGVLTQLGNARLAAQDKAGADPLYDEAVTLARKTVAAKPNDPAARNLLLSALIGQSQTANDPKVLEEALTMGKAMLANGTIDAVNKPSIEIMTGAKSG
ncbi:tetratricopeptide (TPR) repeat protein [Sphingobium fontiphilum]|uniref:Tetratricopeptide (TPR) repeat protein n=1 Tax=Sphingobium fontiphilum TaxID=944425 RepID=A0A7W6DEZ3_9SPHN|nr:hypothetical protein [Sphingobium fontiphilum]MBB3981878.1 tetratricopeptide (TPR) repeat protein [Sphingobium fontiphilum]